MIELRIENWELGIDPEVTPVVILNPQFSILNSVSSEGAR
jgi:hypothetical protein